VRDRDLRAAEHRLQADPDDQDALQHAILARQRSGLPVPGWMHARAVLPARTFAPPLALDVGALLLDGRSLGLGRTGDAPLELPEHRTFWVKPPPPSDATLEDIVPVLAAEGVPGLALAPDVSDAGLAQLGPLADHLTYLDLSACARVTAAGLSHLQLLECLATLRLWYCASLGDEALAALGRLVGVSTLDLSNCTGFSEGALRELNALEELTVLELGSCRQVGDAGLSHLRALPRLTSLDLRRCVGLTDAGLAGLAGSPELTVLNLSFCPELTLKGLAPLGELPRLSRIYLVGCGLDPDKARKALAGTRCEVIA
jgi:Leucine Rich Repeat (LRR) protein